MKHFVWMILEFYLFGFNGGGGGYILMVRSKIVETAVDSKSHAKYYILKSTYIIYSYFKIRI